LTNDKAVLFDVFGTLWHGQASPGDVWREILADLGFDVPADQIERAWEMEWKILGPEFFGFESSGHPNEDSVIEDMFRASERRLTGSLDLTVDPDRLRPVAHNHFTENSVLYPETADVLKSSARWARRSPWCPTASIRNGRLCCWA